MARNAGTNMAFQSGRVGKAKIQVLERGAKLWEIRWPMGWETAKKLLWALCSAKQGHPRVQGQADNRHLGTNERL